MRKKAIEEVVKLSQEELGALDDKGYDKESRRAVRSLIGKRKVSLVSTILLTLFIAGVTIYTLVDGNARYQRGTLTGMLMYQREMYADVVLSDVTTLLSIHDEESYQAAKQKLNFDSELKAKFFREEQFLGDISEKAPDIEILNIEYDLSPDTAMKFLITVKNTQGAVYKLQKVYVLVYNDLISEIIVAEQKG